MGSVLMPNQAWAVAGCAGGGAHLSRWPYRQALVSWSVSSCHAHTDLHKVQPDSTLHLLLRSQNLALPDAGHANPMVCCAASHSVWNPHKSRVGNRSASRQGHSRMPTQALRLSDPACSESQQEADIGGPSASKVEQLRLSLEQQLGPTKLLAAHRFVYPF